MASEQCPDCSGDIPMSAERCPHCARPGRFPNVREAEQLAETTALASRYARALSESAARGVEPIVREFERAVEKSEAVIARGFDETARVAKSDKQLYATYYQLTGSVRLPAGEEWDVLRRVADVALFPSYHEQIRFAALSLNGRGLDNYGECSWVLREDMIAHRASVFEENSVMFMQRFNVGMNQAHELPKGFRASWENRAKLATAKIAGQVGPRTLSSDFSRLLLEQGKSSKDDRFIEAHVWGPITVRTLTRILVKRPRATLGRARFEALIEDLVLANIDYQEY